MEEKKYDIERFELFMVSFKTRLASCRRLSFAVGFNQRF